MFPTKSCTTNSRITPVKVDSAKIPKALRFCIAEARTTNTTEMMLTGKQRLRVTSSAEFATASTNLTNQECSPRIIFDEFQREAVEYCSVTEGIHTHSSSILQIVPIEESPLYDGITKKTQNLRYAEEKTMNLPLVPNWKSALLTTITESELPEKPECLDITEEYNPPMHVATPIPVRCKVENGIHRHYAFPVPVYLPLEPKEKRTIPPEALSFTQTTTYASDYSGKLPHAMMREKQQRLGLATFKLPQHWLYFTESIQKFYINDMVTCYNLGSTYKEIALRHGITAVHVRAILLLQLDVIRTTIQEKVHSRNRAQGVPLQLPSLRKMPTLKQFMDDFDIQWKQSFTTLSSLPNSDTTS